MIARVRILSSSCLVLMLILTAVSPVSGMMMGMNGMGMAGPGMCGGSFPAAYDPPPGGPFRDPVELADQNPDPGIVEVSLEARAATVPINGVSANLLTYNGLYPGPVIRAKHGDIVRLHMKNSLPPDLGPNVLGHDRSETNIHTHGWHVSPLAPSDDVHIELKSGQSYDYEYNLSKQPGGTLALYHQHMHGHVAESVWRGLMGTLVTSDETDLLAGYETHIMVLKDISLYGNDPVPYTGMMDLMMGKQGDIVTVNGDVNPVLSIQPGEIQRWQIVNGGTARIYSLGLEGHALNLIGTDGGLLDKPYSVPYILLAPGERVDLLVQASATAGSYRFLALPYNNGCMSGNSGARTLLTLKDEGAAISDSIPAQINPDARRETIDTRNLPVRNFVLSMMMGRGYISGGNYDTNPYTVNSELGTYEIWEIYNPTMMDHPFHQHLNEGQVLSITGGDSLYRDIYTTAPAWKDDVIVPRGGKVTLLMPVKDYPGMVMFHCHILEHEDIGMMGIWNINAGGMPMQM